MTDIYSLFSTTSFLILRNSYKKTKHPHSCFTRLCIGFNTKQTVTKMYTESISDRFFNFYLRARLFLMGAVDYLFKWYPLEEYMLISCFILKIRYRRLFFQFNISFVTFTITSALRWSSSSVLLVGVSLRIERILNHNTRI